MSAIFSPGAASKTESEKKQEQQTHNPEREMQARRGEEHTCSRGHPERPDKIAGARSEPELPGGPESSSLCARNERAPNHFCVNWPRRPGNRPAKDETINDGRAREIAHR